MRTLGQPNAAFAGDTGAPDPALRAVMADAYAGGLAYPRAVVALCTARLLLPIVAAGDDSPDADPVDGVSDRHAEMAAVLMESASGRKGVVVFTGIDLMTDWRADARPVPCTLDDVAATAVETDAAAIVVDVNGECPVIIEGDLIDHLAAGRRLVELDDGDFGWVWLEQPPGAHDHAPTDGGQPAPD